MNIHRKLEIVKDKKSYSSPAKRTMEKLKPILSKSEKLAERWIWELIQNASDLGDNVIVKFYVTDTELIFVHNGGHFKLEEAFNLIMPDSNKDEDGNSDVKDDMIGQFGTGFISTHVVSSKISVKGIVKEQDQKFNFEFCLDRWHRTDKSELIKSIKKSESEYRDSLVKTSNEELNEFSTQFTYDLSCPYEGLNSKGIVDKGITTLYSLLPFVLPIRTQISKVGLPQKVSNTNNYKGFSQKNNY